MFHEDFALEVLRVAQLHELVRVAGIAVLAAEFAAAVGIDGPVERNALAGAFRDIAARGQIEILDAALGFELGALGGQTGDADELGHAYIFAFYSPYVKRVGGAGSLAGELAFVPAFLRQCERVTNAAARVVRGRKPLSQHPNGIDNLEGPFWRV